MHLGKADEHPLLPSPVTKIECHPQALLDTREGVLRTAEPEVRTGETTECLGLDVVVTCVFGDLEGEPVEVSHVNLIGKSRGT
jgi:hypothetical protein